MAGIPYVQEKQAVLPFGEVNVVSNSFEAKKSVTTEWTEISSSSNETPINENKLDGLKTHEKGTDYLKNYTIDNTSSTTNKDILRKNVSFSPPNGSLGIVLGITQHF